MPYKKIIVFIVSVAISLIAAGYRWGDSNHAMGFISMRGGRAPHASLMTSGKKRYTQITTVTVLPPYRGNARVVLEGYPEINNEIHFSKPLITLGLRRLPEFRENIIYGLEPRDRISLWVVIRPDRLDPVCGMIREDGFIKYSYDDKDYCFCGDSCLSAFKEDPEKFRNKDMINGKYELAFYDTKSGTSLLRVPIIFGDGVDERTHQH